MSPKSWSILVGQARSESGVRVHEYNERRCYELEVTEVGAVSVRGLLFFINTFLLLR
jgi:hypothetical protein